MISTSEIRISVVTRADDVDDAVRAVHTAFGLDADSDEAVVYGGTGTMTGPPSRRSRSSARPVPSARCCSDLLASARTSGARSA